VSAWRHLRAIVLLPGTVTVLVPAFIVWRADASHPGWGYGLGYALGAVLLAIGLTLWGSTVRLFATAGRGTLAPWDPTTRLVVRGPYRYVRNPMISGVLFILLGEAAIAGSVPLLIWCATFFAVNAVYIPVSEEPGLRRRFGADYDRYRANVPRWIPRVRPWEPAP
jgi:protein-S-isoprenylcysteine O-methyltransferase Ste14